MGFESEACPLGLRAKSTKPDVVRVATCDRLADHEAPARAQHPAELTKRGFLVRNLTQHGDEERSVEGGVGVRESRAVADRRSYVAASRGLRTTRDMLYELRSNVEYVERAGVQRRGHGQRVVARPRPNLKQPLAPFQVEHAEQLPPMEPTTRHGKKEPRAVGQSVGMATQPEPDEDVPNAHGDNGSG